MPSESLKLEVQEGGGGGGEKKEDVEDNKAVHKMYTNSLSKSNRSHFTPTQVKGLNSAFDNNGLLYTPMHA